MKARRTFNFNATLAAAQAGHLTGAQLANAITVAEEMGQENMAIDLQRILASRKKPKTSRPKTGKTKEK